jgi:hypothetical protein
MLHAQEVNRVPYVTNVKQGLYLTNKKQNEIYCTTSPSVENCINL